MIENAVRFDHTMPAAMSTLRRLIPWTPRFSSISPLACQKNR